MLTFVAFLASCLCFSGLVVALAAYRIRAVALKQAGTGRPASRRRFGCRFSAASLAAAAARVRRSMGTRSCGVSGSDSARRDSLRVAWFLYTRPGRDLDAGRFDAIDSTANSGRIRSPS